LAKAKVVLREEVPAVALLQLLQDYATRQSEAGSLISIAYDLILSPARLALIPVVQSAFRPRTVEWLG